MKTGYLKIISKAWRFIRSLFVKKEPVSKADELDVWIEATIEYQRGFKKRMNQAKKQTGVTVTGTKTDARRIAESLLEDRKRLN